MSRRDILHGFGAAAAASYVPGIAFADRLLAEEAPYPPALTGLRGSHVGSFEVSHALAREGRSDWGTVERDESRTFDLVVVGAGISGLAAAHFFRRRNPNARVLILDNHDDFGGHAKRNEFDVDGRTVIGYGGSQSLENPGRYNRAAKSLLDDIGVDLSKFESAYDGQFFKRNGLAGATFFDKEHWGTDRLVRYDLGAIGFYMPLDDSGETAADAVAKMPMSERAKRQMLHLISSTDDCMPDIAIEDREDYLYSITYKTFLQRHFDITEPEVFAALENLSSDTSVGIDTATAGDVLSYLALPGVQALNIPLDEEDQPYIHHFPDGNASIARLLVRRMIPGVAPGSTMEDVVTAKFDYGKLDCSNQSVRLRLSSTVVDVVNDGDPSTADTATVTYVKDGQAYSVKTNRCVLACYNSMIPHLCPSLPSAQRDALARQVKAPILYTTVALRNWRAWKKLGVGAISSPSDYHVNALLDFPVSIGDYRFAESTDDPITVHMERFPHRANEGLNVAEQRRLGRYELLATPFETIERNVRRQLGDSLSGGGFDPARDIAGITVNRWAHGYSYGYYELADEYYEDWNDPRYAHVKARQPFGRIAIANSDAGASALLESAVKQAHRAISELGD